MIIENKIKKKKKKKKKNIHQQILLIINSNYFLKKKYIYSQYSIVKLFGSFHFIKKLLTIVFL